MALVPALDLRKRQPQDEHEHLPASLEVEQALLGILLFDNEAFDALPANIGQDSFHEPCHGRIFATARQVVAQGSLADPLIVAEKMTADPALKDMGGLEYLLELVEKAPPSTGAADFARTLIGLRTRRELIRLTQELQFRARQPDADDTPDDMIETAERALLAMQVTTRRLEPVEASAFAYQALEWVRRPKGQAQGTLTGIATLDNHCGPLLPGNLILVGGRPGMGKAQPLDAKVLLRDGTWRVMGELQVGDALASVDGGPSEVAGVYPQGVRQVYRVTFSDGRWTEACAEHLWRVYSRHWPKPRVVSTHDLIRLLDRKRYRGRLWIENVSGDFGEERPLPVDPWVLGVLIGDGCLRGGGVRVSTPDAEIVDGLAARLPGFAVNRGRGIDYAIVTAGGHRRPGVPGVLPNDIKEALKGLGLWGRRSEDKFIPTPYLSASRKQRIDLLRGLLDTDGWVEKHGTVRFATSSRALADDVAALVRSVGGLATIGAKPNPAYTYQGERRVGLPSFVVSVQNLHGEALFTVRHKAARVALRAPRRLTVQNIAPSRVVETQCIRVSHPSSLYVTSGYTVTHNTGLALNIGLRVSSPEWWATEAYQADLSEAERRNIPSPMGVIYLNSEMDIPEMNWRCQSDIGHMLHGPSFPAYEDIRRSKVSWEQESMMEEVAAIFAGWPVAFLSAGGLTPSTIRSVIRRQTAAFARRGIKVGLVVVDHVGLLHPDGKPQDRTRDQQAIAYATKELAKEISCPLMALVQLSREVERRDNKRPMLPDLKDSSGWEEAADMVIFPYFDAYYAEREGEPKKGGVEAEAEWDKRCKSRKLDLIIAKFRGGKPSRYVTAWWERSHNAVRARAPERWGGLL